MLWTFPSLTFSSFKAKYTVQQIGFLIFILLIRETSTNHYESKWNWVNQEISLLSCKSL